MGTAKRFGTRAGKRVRDKVDKIEKQVKDTHKCPQCDRKTVKRVSTGIWKCTKCGLKFAGGAYIPKTDTGKLVKEVVKEEQNV